MVSVKAEQAQWTLRQALSCDGDAEITFPAHVPARVHYCQ